MIKELKLLIADIDGTLVNEPREMMDLTRKVLKDLHKRGVLLGIASGRPIGEHLMKMAETEWKLGFEMECLIGMNGGQLYDNISGTKQSFYQMEREDIRHVIELMKPIDANPFIYIGEDMLSRDLDEMMYAAMKRHNIRCETVRELSDFWKQPTGKVLFRLKNAEDMPDVEAYLAEHPSDRLTYFKTQPTMMEIQDKRVNKGIALKAFCKEHHIPKECVMAFGDMTNDNELLEEAGWGVCLLNGSDDTKACADAITEYTNDEDGFGHYLIDHWYRPNGWQIPE